MIVLAVTAVVLVAVVLVGLLALAVIVNEGEHQERRRVVQRRGYASPFLVWDAERDLPREWREAA